ncbi:hypothetical protein KsCSTR_37920 [Candidatus Kuenenia stuttgartiensis]|uniref:Uncharacterized protein n=1 Tax=Kuenenia stuttgartiensis TaxID=174633 RepID=Q1Q640_KUEST|nr:hypothetical protein KsCSTR_37920 [Candidatus Kuenenia stuttgartiensis]CAJ73031.1 unknown protein [Candidatus Kuenenia stuttgartiensis]
MTFLRLIFLPLFTSLKLQKCNPALISYSYTISYSKSYRSAILSGSPAYVSYHFGSLRTGKSAYILPKIIKIILK